MPNSLNCIYFTKDGILPSHVMTYLRQYSTPAAEAGFRVVLWTDRSRLNEDIHKQLSECRVDIEDYRSVPEVYKSIIDKFLSLGDSGDIASYAIASDILRIAIIHLISEEDIYIYTDCNDNVFPELSKNLSELPIKFWQNPWGLAFPINVLQQSHDGKPLTTELRNDCIIVRKRNNPAFIEHFLSLYLSVLIKKAPTYVVTTDDIFKKEQINAMSCFVSSIPIRVFKNGLLGVDGIPPKFPAPLHTIQCSRYINCTRIAAAGNTWRDPNNPSDLLEDFSTLEVRRKIDSASSPASSTTDLYAGESAATIAFWNEQHLFQRAKKMKGYADKTQIFFESEFLGEELELRKRQQLAKSAFRSPENKKRVVQFGCSLGAYTSRFEETREVIGYDYCRLVSPFFTKPTKRLRLINLNHINNGQLTYEPHIQEDLAVSADILCIRILEYLKPESMALLLFALIRHAKPDSIIYLEMSAVIPEEGETLKKRAESHSLAPGLVASFFAPRIDFQTLYRAVGTKREDEVNIRIEQQAVQKI